MNEEFLSVDSLTVRFGGLCAVQELSFQVGRGSIHALIGPNGAGKSTVFNCISRLIDTKHGDIRFQGRSLSRLQAHQIPAAGIGRTFQNVELFKSLTVLENVLIGSTPNIARYLNCAPSRRRTRVETALVRDAEALLEQAGMSSYRDFRAEELDFGHQKILDVVRALACRPTLLLLDEPAAGLRNREIGALDDLLIELARSRGVTILLIEHVMQLVMSVADAITVLNFGEKIAEGTPAVIRRHPQVIEAYLGSSVDA
jgi:branched-chain amino acid transport system ATP-binding protein